MPPKENFIGLGSNTEKKTIEDNTTQSPATTVQDAGDAREAIRHQEIQEQLGLEQDGEHNGVEELAANDVNPMAEPRTPTPVNKISVHVTSNAPIILLFGAPSSGKTMTLVRLGKYLHNALGYRVKVDTNFCTIWEYIENTRKFNEMLSTTKAIKPTNHNDFLLVQVEDSNGGVVCQILEGAGEDYFPKKTETTVNRSKIPFPPYMTQVFATNNRKVWAFITEPNWRVEPSDKGEYVDRIDFCKQQYSGKRDKYAIIYNKVDTTGLQKSASTVHVKNATKACAEEYNRIFGLFRNPSPWPLKKEYLCEFVPFSTGTYGLPDENGEASYTPSNDAYPAQLWKTIMELIKG